MLSRRWLFGPGKCTWLCSSSSFSWLSDVAPARDDDAPVAAAAALDDSLCSGIVVAVPAAPAVSALVGRAPEASPWFVRRRGVIIDVPEGAVAGSRAIVSLPDDGSARHATVTIAFPPGLSTGQELTVALEV